MGLTVAISIFGYTGTFLTSIMYVPQSIKVIKTKSTSSISLLYCLACMLCNFVWITYSIFLCIEKKGDSMQDWLPLMLSNSILIVLFMPIFVIKITNFITAKKKKMSEIKYDEWHLKHDHDHVRK